MEVPQGKHAWMIKIGEKGQFVIPKEARDLFGFSRGRPFWCWRMRSGASPSRPEPKVRST